ncbi:ribonuclease T2 [Coniochaeta ligniaria NRRL 30616]|uniref:ribonuclease T2 n=1 Tax=Coniochaeta ligniaria NRRL 30616 TaxID=1408157 RepID=A0A1J7JBH4_9PEZI|nr:ribonuclease T2 [Coniochaeta ligniaria NRRL 30616]
MRVTPYHVEVVILALLVQGSSAGLYANISPLNHTCALQSPVLSCTDLANESKSDSCCTETFGGLVLATQLWQTYTGHESAKQVNPKDTWTIHGLWPDFCNGSYTQYCDLSRQYDPLPSPNTTTGTPSGTPVRPWTGTNIGEFLKPFGKLDLLAFMNKYWIAQNQPNSDFWGHEFSKHATCFSSFDVECYGPQYVQHQEVVDFFETVISYYQILPTWGWLRAKDIAPSNETAYSLTSIQAALTEGFGKRPYILCSGPAFNTTAAGKGSKDQGKVVLSEVWYYHHVFGRVQRGQGLRVDADIAGGALTNCATTPGALWYYERSKGSEV